MRVYSVLRSVAYEGEDLLAVFGSRDKALAFARSQVSPYHDVGIVESELDAEIDFHAQVEWVE